MDFLNYYLQKDRLQNLPANAKEILSKVEGKINAMLNETGNAGFDDCLKQYGPDMANIVERLAVYFHSDKKHGVLETLKFVKDVAIEVHQAVDLMRDCVVPSDATDDAKRAAMISFAKELTYFIWMTVNPLGDRLKWIPFKSTIERLVVKWVAGKAYEEASKLFANNPIAKTMSAGPMDPPWTKML